MDIVPADDDPHYHACLSVVAPSMSTEQERQAAVQCFGINSEELADFVDTFGDKAWVEIMHCHGARVPIWQESSNNLRKLMQAARKEGDQIGTLFGFTMDCPYNALGATGWDLLAGNLFGSLVSAER